MNEIPRSGTWAPLAIASAAECPGDTSVTIAPAFEKASAIIRLTALSVCRVIRTGRPWKEPTSIAFTWPLMRGWRSCCSCARIPLSDCSDAASEAVAVCPGSSVLTS